MCDLGLGSPRDSGLGLVCDLGLGPVYDSGLGPVSILGLRSISESGKELDLTQDKNQRGTRDRDQHLAGQNVNSRIRVGW